MLRIYIGFQAIKFNCFPPPRPPPPHFYCFPSTTTTTTATTFLLFSLHHHHHHHHHRHHTSIVFPPPPPPPSPHFLLFSCSTTTTTFLLFSLHHHNHLISTVFPPRDSIRDHQLPFLVYFVAMSRVVNNNRGFLQLLADCPAYQRQFLLKTATQQHLHALVQVYSWDTFPSLKNISGYCCHIRMLYLTWPV